MRDKCRECGSQRCPGMETCDMIEEEANAMVDEWSNEVLKEKQQKKMILLNLFAGPGSGKSTIAAGVFYFLKSHGINCELITEYAKDKVWDKHFSVFDDQLYVTAKQLHRQLILEGQVDVAVTDSPLLLSRMYNKNGLLSKPETINHFNNMIKGLFDSFDNLNYFVKRVKKFNPAGRYQTESEAIEIDRKIEEMLLQERIPYTRVDGNEDAIRIITLDIVKKLNMP